MRIPNRCEIRTTDTKIVLEENLSKIVFNNRSRQEIRKILIDGCVIMDGIRCDFLLVTNQDVELYIELKGSDIDHAIAQIERTMSIVSINKYKQDKICFVISTRCPLLTTKIQGLKVKFKKQYNSLLVIKNRYYEHNI